MILSRESIKSGIVSEIVREAEALGLTSRITDEERHESLRRTLAEVPSGECVWVFGYGSLMWNPAFHYCERRPGRVHGYHRRFCMWIAAGRGSPELAGLMLGLDSGGSCSGMAYCIAPEKVREELEIVWAREMGGGSYLARWVTIRTADGPVRALTFVINRHQPRYAGKLPQELLVAHLAMASGKIGTCAEYLTNTVEHMHALGIEDGQLHDVLERVRDYSGGPPQGRWENGKWLTTHLARS